LKDYFFTPFYKYLSGFKALKAYPISRQNLGLFMTFVVMGYWNGFQNNYVASGILFGMFSVIHNTYTIQCRKQKRDVIFGNLNETAIKYISIFVMFNVTAFAIYIFSGKFPFITN
jgi:membrane protein involved in D-alanine export